MVETNWGTIDWIIVALYLIGSLGFGVICVRYIGRLSDFLVAGRRVRMALLIATMTGTEIGLVTLMYAAQEGFSRGLSAFHIGLIELVCYAFVGLTGFVVFRLRREGVMTVPEYYERRYNRAVRVVGAIILTLAGILNFGLFLKASAQFVGGVIGTLSPAAINWIMTGMLAIVLIYTVLGGMVSVIVTDFFQFIIMAVGMVLATYYSLAAVGGWDRIVDVGLGVRGEGFLNPLAHGEYGVSYALWMILVTVSSATMWMPSVVRCLAADSPRVAKGVYVWTSFTFLARRVMPAVWGAAALAFVMVTPALREVFFDLPEDQRKEAVLAMPIFLGYVIPTGLLGLLMAGMLAAFMSTQSSYQLAWAAVITQDIVAPLRGERLSDRTRINLTRVLIVVIGVFLLIWGLWYELEATLWDYMALTGTVYFAGGLPVLAGGLYWRRASSTGALAALLAGLVALAPIFNAEMDKRAVALFTFVLAAVLMVAFSLLFPDRPKAASASSQEA